MSNLNVGPDRTYSSIASAMEVAQLGDRISLESGYSQESTVVSVNDLSISGSGLSTDINLTLGAGVDTLTLLGNAPINVFDNSGNDTIVGNAGANLIKVTGGIDVAHGGLGVDHLFVDYSDATLAITGTAVNISDGGSHAVTFDGFENFTIYTGSGNDTVTVGDGVNDVRTGNGDDTITVGNGHNYISGGIGNDTITAGDGGNTIQGGSGNDTVTSGLGNDYINGAGGDDTLTGGGGKDTIDGGHGNDTISGGTGNDDLIGGTGHNSLDGGAGIDTADYSTSGRPVDVDLSIIVAQAVNVAETDTLTSIENLTGSAGRDTLTGNAGNNVITGGLSTDYLNGGGGHDVFAYHAVTESTSDTHDVITGYNAMTDRFDLPTAVQGVDAAVTSGYLSTGYFDDNLTSTIGASELSAHDAVLFSVTSGHFAGDTFLIVDANGQAGYQAGEDYVFQLDGALNLSHLATGDFM